MRFLRRSLATLALLLVLFAPASAYAYDVFQNACDAGGAASATCSSKASQEKVYGSGGILSKITKIVSIIAGVASVILVIVSGLFYVLANGDPSKLKGARDTLLGAVVGMVIVIAAQSILAFVLSRI